MEEALGHFVFFFTSEFQILSFFSFQHHSEGKRVKKKTFSLFPRYLFLFSEHPLPSFPFSSSTLASFEPRVIWQKPTQSYNVYFFLWGGFLLACHGVCLAVQTGWRGGWGGGGEDGGGGQRPYVGCLLPPPPHCCSIHLPFRVRMPPQATFHR